MDAASSQYTVIARRFRPQTFDAVVGQEHVATALCNAIAQGRVAHAYLFTGARGVGKTSTARILAKALNCPNVKDGVPCNECDLCQSVSAGQDVDVSEIDGASNRGIDDIRQLRANVNVKSMRTKYKVYIIDEVHMLTKEAFNALLKTLEEPPPGVKFVFCTTEANKVPDTILSRCQRFDFATIETANIIRRLQEIAQAEGFEVEPAAVELVARRAAGSMRDSQSIFDQLLAFGGETITAGDVHRLLGTASDDRLVQLVQALVDRRRSDALEQLDDALRSGVQLSELIDQVLSYLRDLMVLAAGSEGLTLLSVSPDRRERLATQASKWGLRTILAALEILAETKTRMFRSTSSRALAEMAIVRLTLLQDLDRLDDLLKMLRDGMPAATAAGGGSPARVGGATGGSSSPSQAVGSPGRPSTPAAVADVQKKSDVTAGLSGPGVTESMSTPRPAVEAVPAPVGPVAAAAPVALLRAEADEESPDDVPTDAQDGIDSAAEAGSPVDSAEPEESPRSEPNYGSNGHASGANGSVHAGKTLEFISGNETRIWAQVVSQIQDMLKTHVRGVCRVAISGPNELDLSFPRSYHFAKQYCEQPAQAGRLEALLKDATGRAIRVRFSVVEDAAVPAESKAAPPGNTRRRVPETITDPFVQEVMGVFGATVVRVDASSAPSPAAAENSPEGTPDDVE